jgi:tripartite-type tricarboxylate transporter receptor subunit TctC
MRRRRAYHAAATSDRIGRNAPRAVAQRDRVMIIKRIVLSALAVGGLVLGFAPAATAQTYPERPIRLIVPFAPGGPMDTMARFVAQQLQTRLGQPVIVDNRAGGGGSIGSKAVAVAEPDGYTLLWGSSGTISILPELNKKLDYDPRAFAPVALVSLLPHVFVVPPAVPATSLHDFIAYAKANPGKLNFGASLGTPPHLMGAMFKHLAKIDIVYIPYKGAAPSIADMLGGHTHMQFDALTTLYPLIAEGKLRALAVTSQKRWRLLPDVPTMIESGFPTFRLSPWSGVVAPAGTPANVVSKLNDTINEALKSADAQANLAKLNALIQPGSPQDFAAFIADQSPKWAELVRLSGASME